MKNLPTQTVLALLLISVISIPANGQRSRKKQSAVGPAVGSQLDDFALNDQAGKKLRLSDLVKDAPVAFVFHRSADW